MTINIACPTCMGRGWVPGSTEWPEPCPHCCGRGQFLSWSKLARRLGVKPRQLRAVNNLTAGQKVSLLVLERICESFPEEIGLPVSEPLFERSA